MKRFLIILCAMALVFGWATRGVAVPIYDQPPVADAMVNSANPTFNYGSDNTLWIQGSAAVLGSKRMSYLKFDLSSIVIPEIADSDITFISAELGIYFYAKNPGGVGWIAPEVSLHRVSDDSWTEGGITYATKPPPPGSVSSPFLDILQPQEPGYLTWDLLPTNPGPQFYSWESDYPTDLVDNYVSFLIQPAELDKNQWANFWSREGSPQPYLKITYIPEPATVALLGLGALSLLRRKRSA
jgi:hypothetical protein